MSNFVKAIQSMADFESHSPASNAAIKNTEAELGLKFASDYREYIAAFGFASFDGHELTGICAYPRLDVVNVTKEERAINPDVPLELYVVEELGFESMVVWQSATGEVYQTAPESKATKICNSLSEYIAE